MIAGSSSEALRPDRLTEILHRADALDRDARVREVLVENERSTILSRIIRLRVSYERSAGSGPSSLILKTAHPSREGESVGPATHREVAFYAEVAPHLRVGLVPRCFEAHWEPTTGAWRLLLEDLSETHIVATEWPLPPTMPQCERIVTARARFQAALWNDPRLGMSIGALPDDEAVRLYLEQFSAALARLMDRLGDQLMQERRSLLDRFLGEMPRVLASRRTRRHLTVVQGDAHVWNCFLPRDPKSDDVRLFDWDSWRLGAGSDDLAYMMAVHWYTALRRARERPLLIIITLRSSAVA